MTKWLHLPEGPERTIHISTQNLLSNRTKGTNLPPIVVHNEGELLSSFCVTINGPSVLVYDPKHLNSNNLPSVWVSTYAEVSVEVGE